METSACYSPRLEKNIGFAMLPIEHADMGNKVEVETPHGRTRAVTVPKPVIGQQRRSDRSPHRFGEPRPSHVDF